MTDKIDLLHDALLVTEYDTARAFREYTAAFSFNMKDRAAFDKTGDEWLAAMAANKRARRAYLNAYRKRRDGR